MQLNKFIRLIKSPVQKTGFINIEATVKGKL